MEKEEESRGMSGMRCEKTCPFLAPPAQAYVLCFLLLSYAGEFSAREREYGPRYYDAIRASCRGARGSNCTCYHTFYDPADAGDIRNPLKEMRSWSRIRNYAMLRPPLWQSVVLDGRGPGTQH